MQSLKVIRRRIQSVHNMEKVTKAMKLVAAVKLKRAQKEAFQARNYTDNLLSIVRRISRRAGPGAPALMRRHSDIRSLDVLVITSEKGLCGSFNEYLLQTVVDNTIEHISHGIDVKLFVVGRKGWQFLKRKKLSVQPAEDSDYDAISKKMADLFARRFLSGESDGAFLAFNRFISSARYQITFWDFLPLHWRGIGLERTLDYIYEPGRDELIEKLMGILLARSIKQAFLESNAAEFAARVNAMSNATKNAQDMITHLTLEYHKARQTSITSELLDIVGGAEALR